MRARVTGMSVSWPKRVAGAVAIVLFFSSAGLLQAQGMGGLSQLFGGGGGSQQGQGFGGLSQLLGGGGLEHSRGSGQSGSAVMVERGAAPYTGEFTGKEATSSGFHSFSSPFACYPAHDSVFAQTETFVCYAAQSPTQRRSERPDNAMGWERGTTAVDQH
jgi:hypothetical protein